MGLQFLAQHRPRRHTPALGEPVTADQQANSLCNFLCPPLCFHKVNKPIVQCRERLSAAPETPSASLRAAITFKENGKRGS